MVFCLFKRVLTRQLALSQSLERIPRRNPFDEMQNYSIIQRDALDLDRAGWSEENAFSSTK